MPAVVAGIGPLAEICATTTRPSGEPGSYSARTAIGSLEPIEGAANATTGVYRWSAGHGAGASRGPPAPTERAWGRPARGPVISRAIRCRGRAAPPGVT